MGVSALFLGIVLAVATSAFTPTTNTRATEIWGRDANNQYINITANGLQKNVDYYCDASTKACELEYPLGQDPNMDPTGGVQVGEDGVFVSLP